MTAREESCWNAYISANGKEPGSGTQFQHWVAHSGFRNDITFNRAYQLFDTFTGKGTIQRNQQLSQSIQFNDFGRAQSARTGHDQYQHHNHNPNYHNHQQYNNVPMPNNYNPHMLQKQNTMPTMQLHQHKNNANAIMNDLATMHNIQLQNTTSNNISVNINPHPYQFNDQRSRTQSHHNTMQQTSAHTQPRLDRTRSRTEISKPKPKPVPPNNIEILPALDMNAYSLSPKEAIDPRPKDPLTTFLLAHDIRDLKRRLKEQQIELKHLRSLDINDLNDLCSDLKLSAAEKIRFKHAIKELHQQNGSQTAPHTQREHMDRSSFGKKESHFEMYQKMYHNNHYHTQTMPTQIPNAFSPRNINGNGNGMQTFVPHRPPPNNGMFSPMQQTQSAPVHAHAYVSPMESAASQSESSQRSMGPMGLMQSEPIELHLSPATAALELNDDFPSTNSDEKMNSNFKPRYKKQSSTDDTDVYYHNPNQNQINIQFNNYNVNHSQHRQHHQHAQTYVANNNNFCPPFQQQNASGNPQNNHRALPAPPPRSRNQTVAAPPPRRKQPQISLNLAAKKTHRKARRNSIGTPNTGNACSEWRSQWKNLIKESGKNRDEISAQALSQCAKMKQCCCIKRIVFAMRVYAQFQTNSIDLPEIIDSLILKEYSLTDLMNDHFHILEFHKQKNKAFDFIFKEMSKIAPCRIAQCAMMKRNAVSNYEDYILLYRGMDEMNDIISIQILDKLHCSYYHCYDLFRFSKSENRQLSEVSENNSNDLLHNHYYKAVDKLMSIKHSNLKQIKGRDYMSVCESITKYSTNIKHKRTKHTNTNAFGFEYVYDMKQFKSEEKRDQNMKFVKAKHANVKQEMLQNELICFSKKDWDLTYKKCENYYFRTNKINKFAKSKIEIESFLVLYIFANFEEVQRRLKATYFAQANNKNNHNKFVCFAQILRASVEKYGVAMKNYHFYHGLIDYNDEIELRDIYIRFHCPITTTSQSEVIHNYQRFLKSDNGSSVRTDDTILNVSATDNSARPNCNGVILNLTKSGRSKHTKFIDSTWFKTMECEQEQLFFGHTVAFHIVSIIEPRSFSNFYFYLHSMHVLECVLFSKAIPFALTHEENQAMVTLIESVIVPQHRIHQNSYAIIKIFKLFNNFCERQTALTLNLSQIAKVFSANKYVLNFFVSEVGKGVYSINIENVQHLFHNLQSLKLCKHYMSKQILANVAHLYSLKNAKIIDYIEINETVFANESETQSIVAEFKHKFHKMGLYFDFDSRNKIILCKETHFDNLGFKLTNKTGVSVTLSERKFVNKAADYSNVDTNNYYYNQEIFEIQLQLAKNSNRKAVNVYKSYDDFLVLHSFMTKKRSGVKLLKIKSKLPSSSSTLKSQNRAQLKRMEKKIETYLKSLIKSALKHDNPLFQQQLYQFLSSSSF